MYRKIVTQAAACFIALAVLQTGRVGAAEPDLKALPATTMSLCHIDVERLVASQTWKAIAPSLSIPKDWPLDPTTDLADLTFIMLRNDPLDGAVRLRLRTAIRKSLEAYLEKTPDSLALNYGAHVIHVCTFNPVKFAQGIAPNSPTPGAIGMQFQLGQTPPGGIAGVSTPPVTASSPGIPGIGAIPTKETLFVSFIDDQTLVGASSPQALAKLLDVADGKSKSLADNPAEPFKSKLQAPEGTWLTSVGTGADLGGAARSVKTVWAYVGESKTEVFVDASMEMDKPESVAQMKAMIDGLKALLSFSEKDMTPIVDGLTTQTAGDTLQVNWRYPVGKISDLISLLKMHSVTGGNGTQGGVQSKPMELFHFDTRPAGNK